MASINKMVTAYDLRARKDQRRVADARKNASLLKAKLDDLESKHYAELASSSARIDTLEKEKKNIKDKLNKTGDLAIRLEQSKPRKIAEIELLKRQLDAANTLHEANVKKAQKVARREMAEKYQERLAKIEKSLYELKEIKEKELDLAPGDSNLQLLDILKQEDAPTLDAEVAKLTEWRARLSGAHEEFERIE